MRGRQGGRSTLNLLHYLSRHKWKISLNFTDNTWFFCPCYSIIMSVCVNKSKKKILVVALTSDNPNVRKVYLGDKMFLVTCKLTAEFIMI